MAQQIEVPGMGVVEFPDGMSDAQITAAIQKNLQPEAPPVNMMKEIGKVADKSLRGGLLALPGMVGDAAVGIPNWLARKTGVLDDTEANTPGPKGYMNWPSDVLATITGGPVSKPDTAAGKVIGNVGEAVTSAVTGTPGVSSLKTAAAQLPASMKVGLGSGLGSETAGAALQDNPIAKFLGGLVGGGATAAAGLYKADNVDKVARKVFEGVNRGDVTEALKMQRDSRKAGLDLTLPQAMGRETNLDALISGLANSSEGGNTTNILRGQPLQMKIGAEVAADSLPGKVRATRDIAGRSQEAADELIRKGMKEARTAWEKKAPIDAKIPETAMLDFDKKLAALEKEYPNTARAELVADVRKALRQQATQETGSPLLNADGQLITPPATTPKFLSDAFQVKGAIDDVLQHFGARKLNTPGVSGKELQTAQVIREMFSKEGGVLEQHAPDLIAANRAFEQIMKSRVEPLKSSFIGELAGRSGVLDGVPAPQGKLMHLFDQGTQPRTTRSEIRTAAGELNKQDPELFLDAGKTWISTKLTKALNSPGARDSDSMAASLTNAFGSPQKTSAQTQGLSDILAGMADAQKLPPASLQALPKFLNFVAMATARPSTTAGVTAAEIASLEGASAVGRIGHASQLTMLRQPILAYTNRLSSNTRAEVDRLLSSPEGVQMLYELSRTSPWTAAGQKAITAFIAGTAPQVEQNSSVLQPSNATEK